MHTIFHTNSGIHEAFMKVSQQHMNFPGGSDGKEFAYKVGDLGSIPGLGRCPGAGNGYSL